MPGWAEMGPLPHSDETELFRRFEHAGKYYATFKCCYLPGKIPNGRQFEVKEIVAKRR